MRNMYLTSGELRELLSGLSVRADRIETAAGDPCMPPSEAPRLFEVADVTRREWAELRLVYRAHHHLPTL